MPEATSIKSYAKVNYALQVVGQRSDGYHDLITLMGKVSLFDEISITLSGVGIRVQCDYPEAPSGPDNIAYRAAALVLDAAGRNVGVDIRINKNIPVQAGLGGASSNAAAVIQGIDELLGLGLSREQMIELGARIGSDVPFFLFGSPALAQGRGEILTKIEGIPEVWMVIVKPPGGISTGEAYKKLDLLLTYKKKNIIIPKFIGTITDLIGIMSNDFEVVAERMLPEITKIKDALIRLGSIKAMLSGSGSAIFGIFEDETTADVACRDLAVHPEWSIYRVKSLCD